MSFGWSLCVCVRVSIFSRVTKINDRSAPTFRLAHFFFIPDKKTGIDKRLQNITMATGCLYASIVRFSPVLVLRGQLGKFVVVLSERRITITYATGPSIFFPFLLYLKLFLERPGVVSLFCIL